MPSTCPQCGKPIPQHAPGGQCPACLMATDMETMAETGTVRLESSSTMLHGQFSPGTLLDERYRIVSLLGKGGMGEVYRADDLKLRQPVALKMLPRAVSDSRAQLEALYNEVRQARRVSHRHVCRVHDVGEAEGRPFLTMEFIEGEDLGSLIRRIGRLPQDKAFQLGKQLCEGIQAGHEEGVLHLDLKPANLMIDGRGDLRVTDFGLARLANEVSPDGRVAGTPVYMAPEHLLRGEVSLRCDIYAIGLILHEMLTGRRAMQSSEVDAIRDFYEDGGQLETAPEWAPIIQDCLKVDPEQRPSSVADIAHRLPGPALSGQAPDAPASEPLTSDDVYLSYSPIDDASPEIGKEGWISQFQRNLEVRLQQVSGETVHVWKDPAPSEEVEEAVMEQLPGVRAMVSVVSPPSVKSIKCRREVQAFLPESSGPLPPKLLSAVKHPVSEHDLTPPFDRVLSMAPGFEFFERDAETGRVRQFDESFGEAARQRYQEKIYDLAYELAEVIREGKNAGQGDAATEKGRVYLALATTDLQDAYDSLRRELLEDGFTVVPEERLPFDSAGLQRGIEAALRDCDLAIHLLGNNYGFIPENGDVSIVELQNQLAAACSKERGLKRIVWMDDAAVLAEGAQGAFVRRLQEDEEASVGAELVRGNLSALKELVAARLQPPPEEAPNENNDEDSSNSLASAQVYVICDRGDEAAVEVLEDFLFDEGVDVFVPDFEADASQFADQHQRNLARCDAVLIYYGTARKAWVDIMLSDVLKATGYGRCQPIAFQAVYVAPPLDRRKERFRAHSVRVIKQSGEAFAPCDQLKEFVSQIKTS